MDHFTIHSDEYWLFPQIFGISRITISCLLSVLLPQNKAFADLLLSLSFVLMIFNECFYGVLLCGTGFFSSKVFCQVLHLDLLSQ